MQTFKKPKLSNGCVETIVCVNCNILRVIVVYITLDVEHLSEGRVEEAVLIQEITNHSQSSSAQISHIH